MNADKRVLVLSAFICVYRRPRFLFFSPVTEFRSEFVDGRYGEKRLIRVPRSLSPYLCQIRMSETTFRRKFGFWQKTAEPIRRRVILNGERKKPGGRPPGI
jgi:hypothetical protein